MKVIKCINNNVAICLDSAGKEVVVFGKGVGFKKPPYEIDSTIIDRAYYDISNSNISMINDLPSEVIEISSIIINKAKEKIDNLTNSNVVFTLADHIDFAIERCKKKNIKLPIAYDIEQLFQKEYEIGKYSLEVIKEKLNVDLPKEEAAYIALHLINAEEQVLNKKQIDDNKLIEEMISIVETVFDIKIDRENVNCSRFVSHLHYLFKRGKSKHLLVSSNDKLFITVKDEYPKTYDCALKIGECLKKEIKLELNEEEILYLMLHINRLCTREDCNQ
jgi:beta-glucoside operon transcriptional antiterminator